MNRNHLSHNLRQHVLQIKAEVRGNSFVILWIWEVHWLPIYIKYISWKQYISHFYILSLYSHFWKETFEGIITNFVGLVLELLSKWQALLMTSHPVCILLFLIVWEPKFYETQWIKWNFNKSHSLDTETILQF